MAPVRGIGGAPIRTGASLADGCGRSSRTNAAWAACVRTIAPASDVRMAAISAAVRPATETGVATSSPFVGADQASA